MCMFCFQKSKCLFPQSLEDMYDDYDHFCDKSCNGDAFRDCSTLTMDKFFCYGPFLHIVDIWTAYLLN